MFYNYKNCSFLVDGKEISANQISLSLAGQQEPHYNVEDKNSNLYAPSTYIDGSLRLSYYFTGNDPLIDLITNENTSFSGNFGGLYFESGFLRNYSLNATPNTPVVISADVQFYSALSGEFAPNYQSNSKPTIFNFGDANITYGNGSHITSLYKINNLNYNFSCNIEAAYEIGNPIPVRVVRDKKEATLSLTADVLKGDLSYNGNYASLKLNLIHPTNTGIYQGIDIQGIVYGKGIEATVGNLVNSSILIKQNNFSYTNFQSNVVTQPYTAEEIDSLNSIKPTVFYLSPKTGYYGNIINVTGRNLSSVNSIIYPGNIASEFTIISDSLILSTVPSGAIGGNVYISNNAGSETTSRFTIGGAPISIASFSYTTGKIGQKIKINGDNFWEIDKVLFNGKSGEFNVVNSKLIEATVPTGASWGYVSAVSSLFNKSGESIQKFTPFPVINDFTSSGVYGQTIYVSGDAFVGVTGVKFNNLPLNDTASFSITSNNILETVVPSGNVNGVISLYGQSGVYTRTYDYFYPYATPTSILPISGFEGQMVIISGQNFIPEILYQTATNQYGVIFNNATGNFNRLDVNTLSGYVPTGATSGIIKILSQDESQYPSNLSFNVRNGPPGITGFYPGSGKYLDYISVRGTGFINVTGIFLTGVGINSGAYIASNKYSISDTEDFINFEMPSLTGGNYDIVVYTIEGSGRSTTSLTSLWNPFISGFTPKIGGTNDEITISGQFLYSGLTEVYINTTGTNPTKAQINNSSFNSDHSQVSFYIPSDLTTGANNNVIIYNTVGYSSGEYNLYFIPQPKPSGFYPTSGQWGQKIVISGESFDRITGVVIDNRYNTFTQIGQTGLNVTLTTGARSDYITIMSSGGYKATSSQLIITPPLVGISGFNTSEGYPGYSLFVSGQYLDTLRSISFTGNQLGTEQITYSFTTGNQTGIYVTVPSFVSGNNKVKFTNDKGSVYSSNYLYIIPDPIVNYYSLTSGAYGEQLYISGNYLSGAAVLFSSATGNAGYLTGTNTTVINNTGLYTTIPSQLYQTNILISGKNTTLISGENFYPLPTITNFTPTLTAGGLIRVSGRNLYSTQPFIGISGVDNVYRNIFDVTGSWTPEYTNITGLDGISTGIMSIYAKLSDDFAGSGRLFLSPVSIDNISGSPLYSQIPRILSTNYVNVTESAPTITSFSKTKGNSNTIIYITGANYRSVTGVKFTTAATNDYGIIYNYTKDLISVYPPSSIPTGSGILTVYNRYGSVNSTDNFTFIPSLYISGFTPYNGYTGDLITIIGSGMNSVTGLCFGNYQAAFTRNPGRSSYEISGWVPQDYNCCPQYINITAYNEVGSHGITGFKIDGVMNYTNFRSFTTAPGDTVADAWIEVFVSGVRYKMPLYLP